MKRPSVSKVPNRNRKITNTVKSTSRAETYERLYFNDKLVNFLNENKEKIANRMQSGNYDLSKVKDKFKKARIAFLTDNEFYNKFSDYYSSTQLRENLKTYHLLASAIATDVYQEWKLENFFERYIKTSKEKTGNFKNITKRLDAISHATKGNIDKIIDMSSYSITRKDGGIQSALPTMKAFYELARTKSPAIESEIISALDIVIDTFGLKQYMPKDVDFVVGKARKYRPNKRVTEEEFEEFYSALDNLGYYVNERDDYAKSYYNILKTSSWAKRRTINISTFGSEDEVYINNKLADSYVIREALYKELDKRQVKYNKRGEPYMPFIKSTVVREWHDYRKNKKK